MLYFLLKTINCISSCTTNSQFNPGREGGREKENVLAAKCQFRGSHLPQKPLFQLGLMAPRSQAEAQNAQITARYNYQLEKENMPRIYRCVEATKTGGKGSKKEKVLFLKKTKQKNPTEQVRVFLLKISSLFFVTCLLQLPESAACGLEQTCWFWSSQAPNKSGWNLLKISFSHFLWLHKGLLSTKIEEDLNSSLSFPVCPQHTLLKLMSRVEFNIGAGRERREFPSVSVTLLLLAKTNTNGNPLHFI